mmetsp:Transcript_183352/g.581438  ORF Transcript_183352/g.581438 Transcript_183352/m.581438 type:complete len:628 (+) Transcript_183352:1-1884(+)
MQLCATSPQGTTPKARTGGHTDFEVPTLSPSKPHSYGCPTGAYFEVRYIVKGKNATRKQCKMLKMQRLFAHLALCHERQTDRGVLKWERVEVPFVESASPPQQPSPQAGSNGGALDGRRTRKAPTLARIIFRTPCELATDIIMDKQESSGSKTVERAGVGFLERPGVVVTDRHAVPQPLGDVEVTFNQEVTVQARVLFIHPEHNLVLLQVPPLPEELHTVAWLHAKPDDAGTAHTHLEPGTSLQFVGLDACGHEVVRRVSVASLSLPPPQAAMPSGPPRFAERNCEILDLAEPLPTRWSGLLLHDDGSIAAFYALFACQMPNGTRGTRSGGIPREALLQLMQVDDACKTVPALGVELEEITVAALRHERGFDRLQATVPVEGEANGAAAAQAPPTLSEWKPSRPVVLCVARVEKGGPADGTLREGDVLVRAAGSYVRDGVLALSSRASPGRPLALQVFRSGAVASLELVPSADGSDGAERVAIWHGLVCVHTPRALRRAGIVPKSILEAACSDGAGDFPGVYVVRVCYGAPGQSTGMSARNFLLEVDGRPIRCLDDLPPAPATPSPGALGADVRVRVVDHIGREGMQTLRPDPVFWPLIELHRQSDGSWTRLLPSGTAGAESARDQP